MRPSRMLLLGLLASPLAAARAHAVIRRLATLLLSPDSLANPQALARRMGVKELIWDCGYWGAGMTEFDRYPPCFNKHGTRRKRVDPSVAHRNHIDIGLTRAGAARRTSFWFAGR